MSGSIAIAVRGLTKRYPGVVALDDLTLEVPTGRIDAVVGENGAGKSTLMKILAGVQGPTDGEVRIHGTAVDRFTPEEALATHGVALVPQELSLCADLTVARNVLLGREVRRRGVPSDHAMEEQVAVLFERMGVRIDPRVIAGRLGVAEQQMLLVARALARDARILILDEPSAVLSPGETEALHRILDDLRDEGRTLLYVSHRLDELIGWVDGVHVLRDGGHVLSREAEGMTTTDLVTAMVGRELAQRQTETFATAGSPALELQSVSARGCHGVSLSVQPGEVVGIAGLPGSGRDAALEAVFGARPLTEGQVRVAGQDVAIDAPATARRLGVAYVPGERRAQALLSGRSVADNLTVLQVAEGARFGLVRHRARRRLATELADRFGVRAASLDVPIDTLSGGNQQKVVVARWLSISPRVVLMDEPTRGVDVGAKAEIYDIVDRLTASGVGVLMSSSDLPELLSETERIVVMRDGTVVGELATNEATEEEIMKLATGVTEVAA